MFTDPSARRCGLWVGVILFCFPASASAEFKLVEVRPTYGRLGSTRPTTKVLPGDDLHVAFVVAGASKGADGRIDVILAAELLNEDGEVVSQIAAKPIKKPLVLGGDTFTGYMHFGLPAEFDPGKYRVRGVLTDVRTKEEIIAEQEFEVLPMDFGLVRLRLVADAVVDIPMGGNLTVNQDVYIVATGVGYAVDNKRIHIVGRMIVKDAAGKLMTPEPTSVTLNQEVTDDTKPLDFIWGMSVNRPGKFFVQIEVLDKIANKRATYELPIVVSPPPAASGKGDHGERGEKNGRPKNGREKD